MAYVIKDPVPIALASYVQASMFKNMVLQHMPRVTIDGVECLGSMLYYVWKNHWFTSEKYYADLSTVEKTKAFFHPTVAHTKLYNVLGIDIGEMRKQDHSQLEEAWFGFYAPKHDAIVLTNAQISDYIKEFSPMIYPTHTDVFNPVNNVCPVVPVTIPVTPCIFTNLNPDMYKIPTYETRTVVIAYTDALNVYHPTIMEEILVSGPQWDSKGWLTGAVVWHPVTGLFQADNGVWSITPPYMSDAQIINEVANLVNSRYIINDVSEIGSTNRLTLIALLDTANEVFEKSYKVKRNITYTNNVDDPSQPKTTVTTVIVSVKFRRITNSISTTLLTKVQTELSRVEANRLAELSVAQNEQLLSVAGGSPAYVDPEKQARLYLQDGGRTNQLKAMWEHALIATDTSLVKWVNPFSTVVVGPNTGEGTTLTVGNKYGHYRVDAITAMHPVKVEALLKVALTIDSRTYTQKNATFSLGSLLTAVLVVGGLVIAAYTGQWYAAAAIGTLTAVEVVAITLAIYSLVVVVMSVTFSRMGLVSLAKQMIQISQLYGYAASMVGVANMVSNYMAETTRQNIMESIKASVTEYIQSIKDITLDKVEKYVIKNVVDFTKQSVMEILGQTVNFLNQAFTIYANYINPPNKGLGDLQDQLAATEKELADSAVVRPDSIDTVNKEIDDPYNNWIDINEKMQLMSYYMTNGKNVELMSKYYDSGY